MAKDLNFQLLQAYNDGELTVEEATRIEQLLKKHPEYLAALEVDRKLRERVRAAMEQQPSAPAALAARVKDSMHKADAAADTRAAAVSGPCSPQERKADPPLESGNVLAKLFAWVSRPREVSYAAVAAVLVVVAGVVLFSIFGTPVDHKAAPSSQTDLVADALVYVADEHDRCAYEPGHLEEKIVVWCHEEAALKLSTYFGIDDVTIFDLSDIGYEFRGLGRCGMPGPSPSAHLIYRRNIEGESEALMSIFIAPDRGQYYCDFGRRMRSGEWYSGKRSSQCRKVILRTTDDSMVYFLVCCDQRDTRRVAAFVRELIEHRARK